MDVRDLGQGKLSKTDQKKLQQDIKTLTKKVTADNCQFAIAHVAGSSLVLPGALLHQSRSLLQPQATKFSTSVHN